MSDILHSLPETKAKTFVLMDCWYTSAALLNICNNRNFTLIGVIKTNRILYPKGEKTYAANYTASLTTDHSPPVTFKGHTYLVYQYEGALNKIRNAVVLLTYPVDRFGKAESLRAYLCSDTVLSDEEMLEHYSHRWKIEVMFRNF